jgi:hypothetical protein
MKQQDDICELCNKIQKSEDDIFTVPFLWHGNEERRIFICVKCYFKYINTTLLIIKKHKKIEEILNR